MLKTLFREPKRFFESFSDSEHRWPAALGGYYLISFSQTHSNLLDLNSGQTAIGLLPRALAINVFAIPLGILVWGVAWLWLGSRIVGGRASVGTTVRAIGYAFLLPGGAGALLLTGLLLLGTDSTAMLLVYVALALLLATWALALCWKAIRALSPLSRLGAAFAFAWLPLLGVLWITVDELMLR